MSGKEAVARQRTTTRAPDHASAAFLSLPAFR